MANKAKREQILKEAWIGDAVLTLFARSKILHEDGKIDAPKAERMTSNRFLTALGEPSEVEALIGRAYQAGGIEGSYQYIQEYIIPLFERQELNRLKRK